MQSFQPHNGSGETQLITEMITSNLPEGKGLQTSKAGDLTAICEPTV
jgi:uncharacterized protein involved in propanediol utilization